MRRELGRHIKEYKQRNKSLQCNKVFSVTNSEGFIPSTEYFSKEVFSKDLSAYKVVKKGMIAFNPSRINVGSVANLEVEDEVVISPLYTVFQTDETLNAKFLTYFLKSNLGNQQIRSLTSGSVRDTLKYSSLEKILIPSISVQEQNNLVKQLDILTKLIELREEELEQLDELIKSRFVEMFGDLKLNTKGWEMQEFNEFASIDTKMVKDFDKYANYPHIGIDSIEKDTGELKGYRTVTEDGVISGKYLFTPEHIIYSKIRPNLNKVAMPNFEGVCSADAYPILPKKDICTREFLGYTMRSDTFLSYILAFSSRTNLPKVNKNQVEGFSGPIPPIDLQNQFTTFAHQVDKLKFGKVII